MSEKRFSFGDNVNLIIDEETGKSYGLYNFGSVIDFLNKLYDDKIYWEKCYKDLIKQVDTFRAGNEALYSRVRALMEENEQLKFQLKECREHKLYSRRKLEKENEELKQQLELKNKEEEINCRNCAYFISNPSSDSCLKREDIGYKGTCIDGLNYHYLAKNCPYY